MFRDGSIMPLRTNQLITAAIFSFGFIWFMFHFASDRQGLDTASGTAKQPGYELPFEESPITGRLLDHHGVFNVSNSNIQISRIRIFVSQSDMLQLPLMQPLDLKVPASTNINIDDEKPDDMMKLPPPAMTNLNIPRLSLSNPDASAFLFGVATTYKRLYISLDTFSHWLSNSNTSLIAAMEPSLDPDLPEKVLQKAKSLSVPLGTIESGYQFLDRYFSLIQVLYDNRTPSTKWYVLIDDDTFFLDLASLVSTFQTKYDPDLPYYIGALTEDFQQMANWGYMAYGGGGVFLSAPLVEEILPHWKACYTGRNTGDRMLAECIYKHTTTKFTWENNLYQLDLHGDQSGFYEALRPQPLSVHHWKSDEFKFYADMANLSLVSTICGNACLLQKFKLRDNWILTNGYSLVKYSNDDMRHRDIETDISMERTWEFYYGGAGNIHFEHSLGPIRNPDKGKISFRMESALRDENGNVRQLYLKRKPGERLGQVEGAVEIEWTVNTSEHAKLKYL